MPSLIRSHRPQLVVSLSERIAGTMLRQVPSSTIEQWMTHLHLQRARANDMIWLIENGATLHDRREGAPMADATSRRFTEQKKLSAR